MFVPAESHVAESEDSKNQKDIESAVRKISHIKAKGNVIKVEDKYSIKINFDLHNETIGIKLSKVKYK